MHDRTPPDDPGSSGRETPARPVKHPGILAAQIVSMALIWIFVIGIALWILNLIQLSMELDDAPGATVAISLVAIPVFVTLATILTYVFVGLQKEENRLIRQEDDP